MPIIKVFQCLQISDRRITIISEQKQLQNVEGSERGIKRGIIAKY